MFSNGLLKLSVLGGHLSPSKGALHHALHRQSLWVRQIRHTYDNDSIHVAASGKILLGVPIHAALRTYVYREWFLTSLQKILMAISEPLSISDLSASLTSTCT